MDSLLSTSELEKHIKLVYGKANCMMASSGIWLPLTIKFRENLPQDGQGNYCFTDKRGYHFRSIERGIIKNEEVTQNLFEITYWAIKGDISEASAVYEAKNRIPKQDFRRVMFTKRLQLFEAIGPEYALRASDDIKIILRKAPFHDGLGSHVDNPGDTPS
jgi:hypothetical protein